MRTIITAWREFKSGFVKGFHKGVLKANREHLERIYNKGEQNA